SASRAHEVAAPNTPQAQPNLQNELAPQRRRTSKLQNELAGCPQSRITHHASLVSCLDPERPPQEPSCNHALTAICTLQSCVSPGPPAEAPRNARAARTLGFLPLTQGRGSPSLLTRLPNPFSILYLRSWLG